MFQFMLIISQPIAVHLHEESGSTLMVSSNQVFTDSNKASASPSLYFKAKHTQLAQPFVVPHLLQPPRTSC